MDNTCIQTRHVCTCTHFHAQRTLIFNRLPTLLPLLLTLDSSYSPLTAPHITSHHITSHHITSHHITSHHITPHYMLGTCCTTCCKNGLACRQLGGFSKSSKGKAAGSVSATYAGARGRHPSSSGILSLAALPRNPLLMHVKHPTCCVVSVTTWVGNYCVSVCFVVGANHLMHNKVASAFPLITWDHVGSLPTVKYSKGHTYCPHTCR